MQSTTTTNTTLMQLAGAVPSLCAFCCLREKSKWACLLNVKQNKMDGCFEAIKMVLLVPKGEKI